MSSVTEALQQALRQHQAGRLDEAERGYRSVIRIDPRQPDALHLLGIVQQQRGDATSAVGYIRRAIRENPHAAVFHSNLAAAHKARGELNEARACLEEAVRLDPGLADAHYNLGTVLKELGELDRATGALHRTLELEPAHAEAHNNLGIVLAERGRLDEAIAGYRRAIVCRPNYAEAYNNLGTVLSKAGDAEAGRDCYETASRMDPGYTEPLVNLGNSFRDAGDAATAERHYRAALARQRRPDALNNLGVALKDQGRFREALALFDEVVTCEPEHAAAHVNRAFVQRLLGDFPAGWEGFAWRRKTDPLTPAIPGPVWDGSPLHAKTLGIHAEQGVGDQVMFASCVPEIAETAARCVLQCDPRLVPLFARSFPGVEVVGESSEWNSNASPLPQCDAHVLMGSLLQFARPTPDAFPARHSFLKPDLERVRRWRQRYVELPGRLAVGISWRGGHLPETQRQRSIGLKRWTPVLRVPDVTFVNLQYGDCTAELAEAAAATGVTIHDWDDADPLHDLDDFAAQVAALDLVVSIDNSTVHFAGALGVPCWVLVPFVPDWRWMLDREDSPWYYSLRLFRQPSAGRWEGVIDALCRQLCGLVDRAETG